MHNNDQRIFVRWFPRHGAALRERYPLLRHQDAIGAGILFFALAGMIGSATL